MTCAQKNPLSLVEGRAYRGREGINLLVHACHSISLFSFIVSNFHFSSFLSVLLPCCDFFLKITITPNVSPLVLGKGPLYNACHDWLLPFQPLTTFIWSGCTCRPSLVRLCQLCHSLSLEKENYFVCLFAVSPLPAVVWMLSLSLFIPHGMHLVVPTHPYFFQEVCHPSRTFPLKEPEQNPRIGFPLS